MAKYKFYYDESEHSRKLTQKTIQSENYYDNFITAIIGWDSEKESEIFEKYMKFEEKYGNGSELKSNAIKKKRLKNGFASLDKHTLNLIDDLLSLFDEDTKLYFCVASKIEYIILQLFSSYKNSMFFDADALKYIITKAIVTYHPNKVIECIDARNIDGFISNLKDFFKKQIEINKQSLPLKEKENQAFEQMLIVLDNSGNNYKIDWSYLASFIGFECYLEEEKIENYELLLDKEGAEGVDSNTKKAACSIGLKNVNEADSKSSCGLRMADMTAGLISKLLKSLYDAGKYDSNGKIEKKILNKEWFNLSREQLNLYKKLQKVICVWDHAMYKSYTGNYADDLVCFISLLNFMAHFDNVENIENQNMQGEYFNGFVCNNLIEYFTRMKNKLPIEPIEENNVGYFINQRGGKIFYDIQKQPKFIIKDKVIIYVLSVGIDRTGIPLVTTFKDKAPVCYSLPVEYREWAETLIGFANMGEHVLPASILFTKKDNHYYADIL